MNVAQQSMARHAHARRFSPGDVYVLDGERWAICAVAIISNWHVVLTLEDGLYRKRIVVAPDDTIVDRPPARDPSDPQISLF